MKIILGIIGLLLIFIVGASFLFVFGKKATVTIDGHSFSVDVATTAAQKQKGLSDINSLSTNSGMLFPFTTEGYYPFWMKNMKFPLDIIFIDKGKIVAIFKNAPNPKSPSDPLPTYQSAQVADSVLEINAGLSDKYGFKENDTVTEKNVPASK